MSIQLFKDKDAVIQGMKNQIIEKVGPNELFAEFANLESIHDKATLETAKRGYKQATSYITGSEKVRKEITSQINEISKELIQFERELTDPAVKVKQHLKSIIDSWEQAEQKRLMELYQARVALLTDAGYSPVGPLMVCGLFQLSAEQIQEMEESDLNGWIEKGNQHKEMMRKQEEEKQAMLAELEELRKMKAEMEREKQELAAQQAALDATYAQPEPTPQPEPVMNTPSLDFDLPSAPEHAEQSSTGSNMDPVSFNAGVQACIESFEINSFNKKHLYIDAFNALLLPL